MNLFFAAFFFWCSLGLLYCSSELPNNAKNRAITSAEYALFLEAKAAPADLDFYHENNSLIPSLSMLEAKAYCDWKNQEEEASYTIIPSDVDPELHASCLYFYLSNNGEPVLQMINSATTGVDTSIFMEGLEWTGGIIGTFLGASIFGSNRDREDSARSDTEEFRETYGSHSTTHAKCPACSARNLEERVLKKTAPSNHHSSAFLSMSTALFFQTDYTSIPDLPEPSTLSLSHRVEKENTADDATVVTSNTPPQALVTRPNMASEENTPRAPKAHSDANFQKAITPLLLARSERKKAEETLQNTKVTAEGKRMILENHQKTCELLHLSLEEKKKESTECLNKERAQYQLILKDPYLAPPQLRETTLEEKKKQFEKVKEALELAIQTAESNLKDAQLLFTSAGKEFNKAFHEYKGASFTARLALLEEEEEAKSLITQKEKAPMKRLLDQQARISLFYAEQIRTEYERTLRNSTIQNFFINERTYLLDTQKQNTMPEYKIIWNWE